MKLHALLAAVLLSFAAHAASPAPAPEPAPAGDGYKIDIAGSTQSLKVGQKGRLVLAIQPEAPWHVDPRAPMRIQLEAPAGLSLSRNTLARKDAVDPKAEVPRFETPIKATAAGVQDARAHLKFFLCRDTICEQRIKTVAIPVTVK